MRGLVSGIVLVIVAVSGLSARAAENDFKLLGVGAVVSMSPYHGVGAKAMAVPVIVWEDKGFYVKGVEAGYRFIDKDAWSLSVLGAPRFMGYDASDSIALAGMQDKRMSLDAGLRLDIKLPLGEDATLSAKLVNDVLSRYDGREAQLSVSKKFSSKYFQLTPSAGARLQSSKMADYYYGVTSAEATASRPAYNPGHAVNYFTDVMFNFGIHKNWIVMTRLGVEFLDREITKSPIVERNVLWTGIVGLTRRF